MSNFFHLGIDLKASVGCMEFQSKVFYKQLRDQSTVSVASAGNKYYADVLRQAMEWANKYKQQYHNLRMAGEID